MGDSQGIKNPEIMQFGGFGPSHNETETFIDQNLQAASSAADPFNLDAVCGVAGWLAGWVRFSWILENFDVFCASCVIML